jgi:glutathione S-transferase
MKLYLHPVSTVSRPVVQFCADAGIDYEAVIVDLTKGEQLQAPFREVNPNGLVPVLEDGDFRLTESSAILKYLAEKYAHPAYPRDLRARARVNELMDWFNTGFYREYGYHLVYPQLFPHHHRPGEEANRVTVEWGKAKSLAALQVLNDVYLGAESRFLCGDQITIADYFGAAIVTLGELINADLSAYPNVLRWLDNVKALPSWNRANEVFNSIAAAAKGKAFVTLP